MFAWWFIPCSRCLQSDLQIPNSVLFCPLCSGLCPVYEWYYEVGRGVWEGHRKMGGWGLKGSWWLGAGSIPAFLVWSLVFHLILCLLFSRPKIKFLPPTFMCWVHREVGMIQWRSGHRDGGGRGLCPRQAGWGGSQDIGCECRKVKSLLKTLPLPRGGPLHPCLSWGRRAARQKVGGMRP